MVPPFSCSSYNLALPWGYCFPYSLLANGPLFSQGPCITWLWNKYLKANIHKTASDLPPQNSTTDFLIGLTDGISTLPVVLVQNLGDILDSLFCHTSHSICREIRWLYSLNTTSRMQTLLFTPGEPHHPFPRLLRQHLWKCHCFHLSLLHLAGVHSQGNSHSNPLNMWVRGCHHLWAGNLAKAPCLEWSGTNQCPHGGLLGPIGPGPLALLHDCRPSGLFCSPRITLFYTFFGLSWWFRWKRICLHFRRPEFDPWVRKIPWRREWQPTPVFLPGELHGQRSLVGYISWGCKESSWLSN